MAGGTPGARRRVLGAFSVLAVAVLGALGGRPTRAAAQAPLRVMSFNIRYGTAADGAHAWPLRRSAVIATITDHAPHLLGLQEALRFQLDEIGAATRRYREVGVGRDDGRIAGEYAAILVDTLRFSVLTEGTFWLSDTPEVPGSMHWGNRIPRITSWVRLLDRVTADTLRVYNAHWDHESQPSRERSAGLMLERIATDGSPTDAVLVLGDFNSGPTNPAFVALTSSARVALRDAHRPFAPAGGWGGTYHGFRGDRSGEKIDAILVSGAWVLEDAGVDRRNWNGLWASDHFAVWALVVRGRPADR